MARQQQNRRITNAGSKVLLEQQTVVDDSLLPSSEELSKLKEIDPTIVSWIMTRTEKEQDARIKFNQDNMKLAHRDQKLSYAYDFSALICSLVIVFGAMAASVFLILKGETIAGTIFAGLSISVIVKYFLGSRKR